MNTVAHNIAAKLFVAFVAVAMLFTVAAPAKAATAEELQQMINDLLAQVAALQGGAATSGAAMCPYTWTRSLNVGATGADVMKLQQFLNSSEDTRVSASGVGSVGMETEFYGPATAAAVSKFQVKYRSDVLSPAGLVNPTGYFGPGSMAKANALCASATPTPTPDDSDDSDDSSDELSGEASLDSFEIEEGDDNELEEGQEDAPVADVTVEFVDGDAMITRLDVSVLHEDANTDAWDVLDTVSLWVDGEMVAEEDASDEDDYLDEDAGTIRFSGLDIVAMEDEELDITIAVTVQGGVDSDDLGAFTVSADAMRFVDADDVTTTDASTGDLGNPGTTVDFDIQEQGTDDELIVKTSAEDPDGTTLTVEDDAKSDWYTVFAFDLDTDDSVNDIELNEVVVTVTVSSSTYATLIDDAELVIDGVTIDDFTVSSTTIAGPTLTFDVDGDVTIEAGERVTAELNLKFKALALGNEGVTVDAKVTSANADAIVAEGADDLDDDQTSGAATGDAHTLRTTGINVSAEDVSAVVTATSDAGGDYATYEVEVEVTAFEQDVYFSVDPATSTTYSLESGSGASVAAGTRSATLSSTADEESGYFVVNEGETETVTLTVTYIPGTTNIAARLQLETLKFAATGVTPTQTWTASPDSDYRTSVVTIVN